MIGRGLARRVWRAWIVSRGFGEQTFGPERAVYFVGRDVKKSKFFTPFAGQALEITSRRFEQYVRAGDVGFNERGGAGDRTIDMVFGGEMNHPVGLKVGKRRRHPRGIADVGLQQRVAGILRDWRDGSEIGGVGELVA